MIGRALVIRSRIHLALLSLLAVFSGPALAEWVAYSETDDATHYHDPASIQKNANFVRVWTIREMNQLTNYGALSLRVLYELDCKDSQYRVLTIAAYPERMGGGTPVRSAEGGEWQFVIPETPVEDLLGIACHALHVCAKSYKHFKYTIFRT